MCGWFFFWMRPSRGLKEVSSACSYLHTHLTSSPSLYIRISCLFLIIYIKTGFNQFPQLIKETNYLPQNSSFLFIRPADTVYPGWSSIKTVNVLAYVVDLFATLATWNLNENWIKCDLTVFLCQFQFKLYKKM